MAASDPVWFTEEAGQRIAAAVRRLEAMYRNVAAGKANRHFDNELIVDGVASGACSAGGHGLMVPDGEFDAIRYYNTLGDIAGGDNIVIGFSHRSGKLPERYYDSVPVPWILLSAGCDSSEFRFGRPRGLLWLVGIL